MFIIALPQAVLSPSLLVSRAVSTSQGQVSKLWVHIQPGAAKSQSQSEVSWYAPVSYRAFINTLFTYLGFLSVYLLFTKSTLDIKMVKHSTFLTNNSKFLRWSGMKRFLFFFRLIRYRLYSLLYFTHFFWLLFYFNLY